MFKKNLIFYKNKDIKEIKDGNQSYTKSFH